MRAIRVTQFGGPEVLRLEAIVEPQPGAGEVRVRVHAAGVNPVETYVRSGSYARLPALPYTPGADAAGVVEALGEGVRGVAVGMRVYTSGSLSGTYAERAVCAATDVHPLPERVSFAQGAALGVPYASAYRALVQRARAAAGETVLVHGASGGVGTAAVQLARALGLRVAGSAGSEAGRALVAAQGAHLVLDHHAPGYLDALRDWTGGCGVNVILEMLANVNLGHDFAALAPGGRVVVVGSRGPVEVNPRELMARDAAVLGMLLFNTPPTERAAIHAGLYAGLENGTLRPVIAEEIPLAEAARAHAQVMQANALGKLVLVP